MPRLPRISGKKMVGVLRRKGFIVKRQKGSHIILVRERKGSKKGVVVPNHKELDVGTLKEILRQAGMNRGELFDIL